MKELREMENYEGRSAWWGEVRGENGGIREAKRTET